MRLKIVVKPNAAKTEILGWNAARGALQVSVAAPPDKNKANLALLKFLSKFGEVKLVSGFTSREKIVEFRDKPEGLREYLQ